MTFTSVTALDLENRQLLISERHELIEEGGKRIIDYHFAMRCWEREELNALLARYGFERVSCFGDRVVVVAQRGSAAA